MFLNLLNFTDKNNEVMVIVGTPVTFGVNVGSLNQNNKPVDSDLGVNVDEIKCLPDKADGKNPNFFQKKPLAVITKISLYKCMETKYNKIATRNLVCVCGMPKLVLQYTFSIYFHILVVANNIAPSKQHKLV